jgi:hypothetical protein
VNSNNYRKSGFVKIFFSSFPSAVAGTKGLA